MTPLAVHDLHYGVRPHFWSARKQILHGVHFEVEAGEIFGFLGPNGAGKTTSIKSILGLLQPDAGDIRILDGSIRDPSIRARIGFLPERSYYPEHLTGREVVLKHALLAGLSLGDARRRAQELLERVGIAYAADRLLRGYSK
ncbi:MAG: ATP-binding cassette domain-containing protein, partial [Myxococcota bacterium]